MLRVDERNPRARALWAGLSPLVDLTALDPAVCLVVGGDGWLLRTVRELGHDRVYLGLNAGTLGFLLNEVEKEGDEAQKNDILRHLLEDFAKPALDLRPSRVGSLDIIGNAYEFLIERNQ